MEWSLIAAVAAVIAAVAAIIAVVYAHRADRDGKRAAESADHANTLATTSNRLAAESKRIAEMALTEAREANGYNQRDEDRQTELHDVKWDGYWAAPGRFVVRKLGQGEARSVSVDLSYDGGDWMSRTADVLAVDMNEVPAFEIPEAEVHYRERQAEIATWTGTFPVYGRLVRKDAFVPAKVATVRPLSFTVRWTSPSGAAHSDEYAQDETFDDPIPEPDATA